jgi:hypothetical protein
MFRKQLLFLLSLTLLVCFACNKANDATITTDIQAKMFADALLKSASINVSTKDGIVTHGPGARRCGSPRCPKHRLADARRKASYRFHIHGAASTTRRIYGAKRSSGSRHA